MVPNDDFKQNHYEESNQQEFDENFIESPSDNKQCEENNEKKMEAQNSMKKT